MPRKQEDLATPSATAESSVLKFESVTQDDDNISAVRRMSCTNLAEVMPTLPHDWVNQQICTAPRCQRTGRHDPVH